MGSKFWLIVALMLGWQTVTAQKAAVTIDALYQIKQVSDPQISPDGRKIAFVVTSYHWRAGKKNSDIYLIDANGKNLMRMTRFEGADFQPRWSKDGQWLLFLSTRKNGIQAWRLPVKGGEPEQLTDFYTGVAAAQWVADSHSRIAFVSKVFPECGANNACNQEILEDMRAGPLRAHMADHLLYRHWTSYSDGRYNHVILYDHATGSYSDLTPGEYNAPAMWGEFTISPDGQWLCVESNHTDFPAENTNKDLFLYPLQGGNAAGENITRQNEAYDGQPLFSPNGRYIAFQRQRVPGYEADLKRLALYDRKSGRIQDLSERLDNWSDHYHWSADSRYLYFRVHEQGHFPLYRYDLKKGTWRKIVDLKTIDSYSVSPDNRWLAVVRRTINKPTELFRVVVRTGEAQRLTFFNKHLEDSVDFRPAEEVWVKSPSGRKIHTFIIKPHNFDPSKKYPLILNVHGGPQFQWYDGFRGDWQVYPAAGYVVAFPNPHGSTGYGQAFTAAISRDWAGKVYQDIMAVSDFLAALPYVDEQRMGAMGWSWGGYFMMWLEGHTTRFKALAAMMGVYDLPAMYGATEELWFPEWDLGGTPWVNRQYYQQASPHNYVQNFKTPCLVITGEKDYRVPYTQSLEFFTALQKMRVPSRLIVFTNDGHWPDYVKSMPFYYNAHLDWFHRFLGGAPAPFDMRKMWRNQLPQKP